MTPKNKEKKTIHDFLNRNEESPLDKSKQKVLKTLIKRHENDGILTIPTRGQPQKYVRVVNPRNQSIDASEKIVENVHIHCLKFVKH